MQDGHTKKLCTLHMTTLYIYEYVFNLKNKKTDATCQKCTELVLHILKSVSHYFLEKVKSTFKNFIHSSHNEQKVHGTHYFSFPVSW